MRSRWRRLLGVSTLSLLLGLGTAACSGSQQEEEGMEVSDNQAAENDAAPNDNQAGNDEGGEANDQQADNNVANEDSETADAGNGTENDLQEIIQEMNGSQGDAMAGDTALQQNAAAAAPIDNTAMAQAPVDNSMQAAPAPASPTLPFQPGGSPAGNGLPELGSKMAYVVEQGDTLAKISQRIYGTPGRWNELATLSGITTPSRIYPGDLVYYTLDEGAVNFAQAYEAVQRSEEQVKPGDTLATIASRVYGTSKGWRSIWRQNDKIDNPDILAGSTVFYIPKGAAAAAVKLMKSNAAQLAKVSKNLENGKSTVKVTKVKGFKLADGQKNISKVTKTNYGVRLI
jgi:nucleoid-associated protein YgaU